MGRRPKQPTRAEHPFAFEVDAACRALHEIEGRHGGGNVSGVALATLLGVSRGVVSRWRRGAAVPHDPWVRATVRHLAVSWWAMEAERARVRGFLAMMGKRCSNEPE